MPRRRFFVPGDRILDQTATLPPDRSHHLTHVLRIRSGHEIEIFDGQGSAYCGTVEISGGEVRVTRLTPLTSGDRRGTRSLVLAAALIKGEKFEWIIQKATELGMDEFVPLETRRCNIRIPDVRRAPRLARWRTIAEEASKQCRRDSVPIIHEISGFPLFVSHDVCAGRARYLCYEQSAMAWNQEFLRPADVVLCIGPEGGWDPGEVDLAVKEGFRDFSLGSRILRSETAALAALTLFQLTLSDSGVGVEG
jgi:16S rRNA (uracil1498-N3)-methyltransferase